MFAGSLIDNPSSLRRSWKAAQLHSSEIWNVSFTTDKQARGLVSYQKCKDSDLAEELT
jgi:hypothetical protein